jgi:hypothetical protein
MVLKAASVALLWLLTASVADAAPALRADRTQACNAQTATMRRVVRPRSAHVGDNRDAIQIDDAVASADRDGRTVPGLCPVGIVAGSAERHVPAFAFSPRSPRGPPPPV